jgi:Protein of unknown function (DUF1257)
LLNFESKVILDKIKNLLEQQKIVMSHFTTIELQIKDGKILEEVLRECGYQIENNTEVRGYQGNTTRAEYVLRQANGYDIGFRLKGETYQVVSDWWGAKIDRQAFLDTINQKYAHKMLLRSVKEQGFTIEEEQQRDDGTLRVVVGKWV